MAKVDLQDKPPEPCVNDTILYQAQKCIGGVWVPQLVIPPAGGGSGFAAIVPDLVKSGATVADIHSLHDKMYPPCQPCGGG